MDTSTSEENQCGPISVWSSIIYYKDYRLVLTGTVCVFNAHRTPRHSLQEPSGLEGFAFRHRELLVVIYGGEPEAEAVGEVVAGAALAVAFDERRRSEVLEAGAGTRQSLPAALATGSDVLKIEHKKAFNYKKNTGFINLSLMYKIFVTQCL